MSFKATQNNIMPGGLKNTILRGGGQLTNRNQKRVEEKGGGGLVKAKTREELNSQNTCFELPREKRGEKD